MDAIFILLPGWSRTWGEEHFGNGYGIKSCYPTDCLDIFAHDKLTSDLDC